MTLFTTLIGKLLPNLAQEVAGPLLADLRAFVQAQVVDLAVRQVTRAVTKGVDGLVKILARHLAPPDAHAVTHGVVDEFHRQQAQLVEALRLYADAAYQVEAAKDRGDAEAAVNGLRTSRAHFQAAVEAEMRDVFAVLTGGTPED
jgi:hypothetical protein